MCLVTTEVGVFLDHIQKTAATSTKPTSVQLLIHHLYLVPQLSNKIQKLQIMNPKRCCLLTPCPHTALSSHLRTPHNLRHVPRDDFARQRTP